MFYGLCRNSSVSIVCPYKHGHKELWVQMIHLHHRCRSKMIILGWILDVLAVSMG